MSVVRRKIALAVALAALAGQARPGLAAVRVCEAAVSGGLKQAASEREARKAALDAWKAEALKHGESYTSWRLANGRFLECLPAKAGGFECLARGAPCKIEQVAPQTKKPQREL